MSINTKSDVRAKEAFVEKLKDLSYRDVRITGSPAGITASKDGKVFYFEIKYTAQEDTYFGAATLTEWGLR